MLEGTNGALEQALVSHSEIETWSTLCALSVIALKAIISTTLTRSVTSGANVVLVAISGVAVVAPIFTLRRLLGCHQERKRLILPARVAVVFVRAASLAWIVTLDFRQVLELVNWVQALRVVKGFDVERLSVPVVHWVLELLNLDRDFRHKGRLVDEDVCDCNGS